ncbi:MAG: hypothetical protein AB7O66_16260 [Limisphaerales bacterium]
MRRTKESRWWIAAGLLAAVALSSNGGSYLAREGPPALRFRPGPKPNVEKTVLPPLALSSAPTGSLSTEGDVPEEPDETEMLGPELPEPDPIPYSEPIVIPPAAAMPQNIMPGLAVTPQVLLSYFGTPGTTNGVNPVVLAPVSFVPPQPSAAGSSRATYRQVP